MPVYFEIFLNHIHSSIFSIYALKNKSMQEVNYGVICQAIPIGFRLANIFPNL